MHHGCISDAALVLWLHTVTGGYLQVTRRNLMHISGGTRGQPRHQVCVVVSARGVGQTQSRGGMSCRVSWAGRALGHLGAIASVLHSARGRAVAPCRGRDICAALHSSSARHLAPPAQAEPPRRSLGCGLITYGMSGTGTSRMIPTSWPYSQEIYEAFTAIARAGFTHYCCGDRRAPYVLI